MPKLFEPHLTYENHSSPRNTIIDISRLGRDIEDMDLRWRHIETALIKLLGIRPEGMGAFRARLRHLKTVGVPDIPKVGSGTQITYTKDHAHSIYIAFILMGLGVTPKTAASMVFIWKKNELYFINHSNSDVFGIIYPTLDLSPTPQFTTDISTLNYVLSNGTGNAFTFINISKSVRDIDAILGA